MAVDKAHAHAMRFLQDQLGAIAIKPPDMHFASRESGEVVKDASQKRVYPRGGVPDIFAVWNYQGFFVEVKNGDERFPFSQFDMKKRAWIDYHAGKAYHYWMFLRLGTGVRGPHPYQAFFMPIEVFFDVERSSTQRSISCHKAIHPELELYRLIWVKGTQWELPTTHPFINTMRSSAKWAIEQMIPKA